jgi:hypothetical protein
MYKKISLICLLIISTINVANSSNIGYYEHWISGPENRSEHSNSSPYSSGTYTIHTNWDDEYNHLPFEYEWYIQYPLCGPLNEYEVCDPVSTGETRQTQNIEINWTFIPYGFVTIWCKITRGGVEQWEGFVVNNDL